MSSFLKLQMHGLFHHTNCVQLISLTELTGAMTFW